MLELGKYSVGVGDRFAHEAEAQLQAFMKAREYGVDLVPVWNKSNREHLIVGSQPASVRKAADIAVRNLGWTGGYHVDADHIRLNTVDAYLDSSDFFTIDVADSIGTPADHTSLSDFVDRHPELVGTLTIPRIDEPLRAVRADVERVAAKYLVAAEEAGKIHTHILAAKGADRMIAEVSMDETDAPQTPFELLVILALLADQRIALQTIAPKFTGRFNKGVDYVGDIAQFEREFNEDLAVIAFAIENFGLPRNLKLSVHSGSDKFSIYGPIRRALARFDAGVHIKTAGTTWLEELIGLAEAEGEGLTIAREIYCEALDHLESLCAPYAAVIDIDAAALPTADQVRSWSAQQYAGALRHNQASPLFNPSFRQLLHVGYKVAAQMGERYLNALETCRSSIARNVTSNLFDRHIAPLFFEGD